MKNLKASFAQYLRTIGYQSSTQSMMRHALKEFEEKYPKLEEVSKKEIELYAIYLSHRPRQRGSGGLSSSMLRHYLYGLKVFFSWCEQTNRIEVNPMSAYVLPEVEKTKRNILSKSEIKEVYEVCETNQDRAILGLFYGCGLRRSEGEQLNGSDINFKESLVYVRKGKGGKRRVIPMSKKVSKDFRNYYEVERGRVSNQLGFILNEKERRMSGSSYNERVKILVKKAGILRRITLHSLRHSIATHLLEEGLNIEQVRDFLGHGHLETTQIYTYYDSRKLSL